MMTSGRDVGGAFGLWRVGRRAALAVAVAASVFAAAASAQEREQEQGQGQASAEPSDAMLELFARAADGSGDAHLPYVLNNLKRALATQNMLGFLDLVDPAYFTEQFNFLHRPNRSPGETLGQFSCEFFSICDISKSYRFHDIVSADVVSVKAGPGRPGGLIEVRLELRMWDGLVLPSVIYYDPATARLSAASG